VGQPVRPQLRRPIREAITDQLGKLDHIMLAGLTHPPVVELSERLGALTGLGHAFYASDGASATEIALKMSAHSWRNRGQPEKNQFIGLQGGYHGETAGAPCPSPTSRCSARPTRRCCA
jgi:adenosylmethionine-8-amino-7-oxononanoate aminotransferase